MACDGCTLNAEWLKRRFLFGVSLTDDFGNDYPDEMFDLAIQSAIFQIETELGIVITKRQFVERLDMTFNDYLRSYQIQLSNRPLDTDLPITWRFKVGNSQASTIPADWVQVRDAEIGIIEIIPGLGTIPLSWGAGGFYWYGRFYPWDSRIPAFHEVTYTAGLCPGAGIPADIQMAIGWIASMLPLDTAGDLIAGAGVASYSIGMDGLSQSLNTTSSATNSGYGARILSYQKQLEKALPRLRGRYRGVDMFAI